LITIKITFSRTANDTLISADCTEYCVFWKMVMSTKVDYKVSNKYQLRQFKLILLISL